MLWLQNDNHSNLQLVKYGLSMATAQKRQYKRLGYNGMKGRLLPTNE
ncbi:hypothetical protein AOT82_1837 [Psychrobacter sp. AntiMn-1]|nr:hypothetical protein AOT82_1837 [Psychrobacter sp. AntiMn-1]